MDAKIMIVKVKENANDYIIGVIYGIMLCHRSDPYAKWGYGVETYMEDGEKVTVLRVMGDLEKLRDATDLILDRYGEKFVKEINIVDFVKVK